MKDTLAFNYTHRMMRVLININNLLQLTLLLDVVIMQYTYKLKNVDLLQCITTLTEVG